MTSFTPLIQQAAALLRQARSVVALTGAGLSTPSGIPDFRSAGSGLWETADPREVASLAAFRYHPDRFFAWVRPLVLAVLQAAPNAAHQALAELEEAGLVNTLITQNIDALHLRAGSRRVLEVHGHLRSATCGCCHRKWAGAPVLERFAADGQPPTCAECGGLLKPDVILMGEQLPEAVLRAARAAVRQCDLLLVAGSSLEVMPSAAFPEEARLHGARLIIVNLSPTYMDDLADVVIRADVAEALPALASAAMESRYA